jgi:hypothetical protein
MGLLSIWAVGGAIPRRLDHEVIAMSGGARHGGGRHPLFCLSREDEAMDVGCPENSRSLSQDLWLFDHGFGPAAGLCVPGIKNLTSEET